MNRGMWWVNGTSTGHWPVNSSKGFVGKLLSTFLNTSDISSVKADNPSNYADSWYTISGNRISKPEKKGIYINGGKKVIVH